MGLYFDPDDDPATRKDKREEFVRAVASSPQWAIEQAFDDWVRTGTRRPTPGDIVILVGRALKPMTDELARRRKMDAAAEEQRRAQITPERTPEERDRAQRIVDAAGLGLAMRNALARKPMAGSLAEAAHVEPTKPHWTETADPDGPEMAQLRAARAANPIMAAAMMEAARKRKALTDDE